MMRTHVLLPVDLVEEIDAIVGQRKRSRFIAEAVAAKLEQMRLEQSFEAAVGSLAAIDIPGWETPESTAEWVAAQRVDRGFMEDWVGTDETDGEDEAPGAQS